jgi:hypothetical protein
MLDKSCEPQIVLIWLLSTNKITDDQSYKSDALVTMVAFEKIDLLKVNTTSSSYLKRGAVMEKFAKMLPWNKFHLATTYLKNARA